jgi:hypothetical protein
MMDDAESFAHDLIQSARSDVAVKLQAVDEACRSIIESGGTVSVSSVRGWVSTNRGLSIASSTLMNLRRNSHNGEKDYSPARRIINKYTNVQKFATKRPASKIEPSYGSFALSDSEMREIQDHSVRYKVQLMAGRLRNLENQLNQLRTINKLPALPPAALSQSRLLGSGRQFSTEENAYDANLDEEEINALNDFLDDRSMRIRKLEFSEVGALKATYPASSQTSSSAISKPFLKDALQKILRPYMQK